MHLEHLKTFRAIAEERHFAKAAARRNLSQPAVSHQIAQLEEEVGARLFNRKGRSVSLTVVGQILLEECGHVLSALDRAEERVHEASRGVVGRIRLGASSTAGLYLLPDVIAGYRAAHPTFDLGFEIGHEATLFEKVTRNALDMIVVAGDLPTADLKAAPLVSDGLVAVCGKPVKRPDLKAVTWLLREPSSDTRHRVDDWMKRVGIEPVSRIELCGPDAVKRAVRNGMGVGVLSRRCIEEEIEVGTLHEVAVPRKLPERTFKVVDHKQKHHGVACRAMLAVFEAMRARAD